MNHPCRNPGRALRHLVLLLGLLGPLLVLPGEPRAGTTTRFETQGSQGYRGTLEFQAAPPVTMRPIGFSLALIDPSGQRTAALPAACDLIMPAMPMPENRPRLVPGKDLYNGEAIFTMAGRWQAVVTFQTADGRPEKLVFDLGTVLLK
jgi:hypothetical protein